MLKKEQTMSFPHLSPLPLPRVRRPRHVATPSLEASGVKITNERASGEKPKNKSQIRRRTYAVTHKKKYSLKKKEAYISNRMGSMRVVPTTTIPLWRIACLPLLGLSPGLFAIAHCTAAVRSPFHSLYRNTRTARRPSSDDPRMAVHINCILSALRQLGFVSLDVRISRSREEAAVE